MEIERKFLVKTLPNLVGKEKIECERYYLPSDTGIEIRIQKKAGVYEWERKVSFSNLSRKNESKQITQEEFEALKNKAIGQILRESYLLSENPRISLKVYHGDFEGLVRAEVEFLTESEALNFIPLDWMGTEITDSVLGRDSRLLQLSQEEFRKELEKLKI